MRSPGIPSAPTTQGVCHFTHPMKLYWGILYSKYNIQLRLFEIYLENSQEQIQRLPPTVSPLRAPILFPIGMLPQWDMLLDIPAIAYDNVGRLFPQFQYQSEASGKQEWGNAHILLRHPVLEPHALNGYRNTKWYLVVRTCFAGQQREVIFHYRKCGICVSHQRYVTQAPAVTQLAQHRLDCLILDLTL